ncbi:peptidoglycan editing factor PgeF [Salinisphaera aquimarina]|uniref:Purine nucleoside phosphorylase n=1 Tax=Salinisphaera aquimarina TaxID=2094031 RepID=A0ABV7EIB9_9GAMM
MSASIGFLEADWPAPPGIRAGTTLRRGGVSRPPFDSLNLGAHTTDDSDRVETNRRRVCDALELPADPAWLTQVHGITVADADRPIAGPADASVARHPNTVCAVLTADCLPVVFCDRAGTCWGAAHAGWRGLAAGVLEATIAQMPAPPDALMAWLGPSIGAHNFEVGEDVKSAFSAAHAADASWFVDGRSVGKYLVDIYALARARLARAGVTAVYGGGLCTIDDATRFYSYRRAPQTGRMATLTWSLR